MNNDLPEDPMNLTTKETADYICSMLDGLLKMAQNKDQAMMAHVLWLARVEAQRVRDEATD